MGGYLNKVGLQGNTFDTDVRVLKEPRTVPYNRIGSRKRIGTVSVPYRSVTHCWQTSDYLEFLVDFSINAGDSRAARGVRYALAA